MKEGSFGMISNATEQVASWFESNGVRAQLEKLVHAWDAYDLLGIDLADQLRQMVEKQATKAGIDAPLDDVDWSLLAERYAEEIAGVDEAELIRRREKHTR